jgi:hypothetical protein
MTHTNRKQKLAGRMKTSLGVVAALAFIATLATGCAEERIMSINHYMRTCAGVGPRMCMLHKDQTTEGSWYNFYSGIQGFEYEWGYAYELRVAITDVADPPADGSSKKYHLIEVIKATPVTPGTTFEIAGHPAEISVSDTSLKILTAPEMLCKSAELCADLRDQFAKGPTDYVTLTVAHPELAGQSMVVQSFSITSP